MLAFVLLCALVGAAAAQNASASNSSACLLALGGEVSPEAAAAEIFCPLSNTWSNSTPMLELRSGLGAVVVNGSVIATGGVWHNSSSTSNQSSYIYLASVEMYNATSNTWSFISALSAPRAFHCSIALGTTVYVFGGETPLGLGRQSLASMEVLSTTTGTWLRIARP